MVREQLIETLSIALPAARSGSCSRSGRSTRLMQLAPAGLPRRAEVALGWRVVAFSLTAAVMTGLVFGLFPGLPGGARVGPPGVERRRSHQRRR